MRILKQASNHQSSDKKRRTTIAVATNRSTYTERRRTILFIVAAFRIKKKSRNWEEMKEEKDEERLKRLTKEAEERNAIKQNKQRTHCIIEIKPCEVLSDDDLLSLWKKVTSSVNQDGLEWGETCKLEPVAFGIKKVVTSFTMGVSNSSEDVVSDIEAMENDVQSVEIISMNVL